MIPKGLYLTFSPLSTICRLLPTCLGSLLTHTVIPKSSRKLENATRAAKSCTSLLGREGQRCTAGPFGAQSSAALRSWRTFRVLEHHLLAPRPPTQPPPPQPAPWERTGSCSPSCCPASENHRIGPAGKEPLGSPTRPHPTVPSGRIPKCHIPAVLEHSKGPITPQAALRRCSTTPLEKEFFLIASLTLLW